MIVVGFVMLVLGGLAILFASGPAPDGILPEANLRATGFAEGAGFVAALFGIASIIAGVIA